MLEKIGKGALVVVGIILVIVGVLFLLEKAGIKFGGGAPVMSTGSVSPATLDHNYQETLFLVYGKDLTEEVEIGGQPLVGVSVKTQDDQEIAAGFLQIPPEVDSRLGPGRYDVVVKENGDEVAKLVKAVEVLPNNPYAMTKWPWWLGTPWKKAAVAVAMIFVVAVIGGAIFFIFRTKKKPAKKATTPAQPPVTTP